MKTHVAFKLETQMRPRLSPKGTARIRRLTIAATFVCALAALTYLLEPIDGYDGWAASWLAAVDDTVYSTGYTDRGFRRIKLGMTEQEVRSLVGEPLDPELDSKEGTRREWSWRYAKSANSHSYHVRTLRFRDGRVSQIYREYYVD